MRQIGYQRRFRTVRLALATRSAAVVLAAMGLAVGAMPHLASADLAANTATVTGTCQENTFSGPNPGHNGGATTTAFPADGSAVNVGDAVGAQYDDEAGLATTDQVINTIQVHAPVFTLTNNATHVVTPVTYTLDWLIGSAGVKAKTEVKITGTIPSVPSGDYSVFLMAWDLDQNAKPDCGVAQWTLHVTAPPPDMGTLTGNIVDCTTGSPGSAITSSGTIAAAGPQAVPAANPLSASVLAGSYTENATAPLTYHFLDKCGAGSVAVGVTTSHSGIVVPPSGTGSWTFYVARDAGNLLAHIYLCDGSTQTATEVLGGSLAASGPTIVAAQPNPLTSVSVSTGAYTVSATTPANYHFVTCGNYGGQSSLPASVTTDTPGTANFYVAHDTGALGAHIYACNGGSQTTNEVAGGTLAASGPTTVPVQANPLGPVTVSTGDYTVNATAPATYHFITCGSYTGQASLPAHVTTSTPGSAIFYVSRDAGTLNGHIYNCASGTQTTTEVAGGTLAAAGPTAVAALPNPISVPVNTGSYSVTATAPAGYAFVTCGSYGGQGTLPATVTSTTPGTANFYVNRLPGTLLIAIYLCTPQGVQSLTAEPGTVSTSPSVTVTNGVPVTVPAGTYLVTATPGTGFELVKCGASGDNPSSVVVPPAARARPSSTSSRLFSSRCRR